MSRICAREAALDVLGLAVRLVRGMDAVDDTGLADFERALRSSAITACAKGLMADMDVVAKGIGGARRGSCLADQRENSTATNRLIRIPGRAAGRLVFRFRYLGGC